MSKNAFAKGPKFNWIQLYSNLCPQVLLKTRDNQLVINIGQWLGMIADGTATNLAEKSE